MGRMIYGVSDPDHLYFSTIRPLSHIKKIPGEFHLDAFTANVCGETRAPPSPRPGQSPGPVCPGPPGLHPPAAISLRPEDHESLPQVCPLPRPCQPLRSHSKTCFPQHRCGHSTINYSSPPISASFRFASTIARSMRSAPSRNSPQFSTPRK